MSAGPGFQFGFLFCQLQHPSCAKLACDGCQTKSTSKRTHSTTWQHSHLRVSTTWAHSHLRVSTTWEHSHLRVAQLMSVREPCITKCRSNHLILQLGCLLWVSKIYGVFCMHLCSFMNVFLCPANMSQRVSKFWLLS